ncbi:MAG: hypothetical protein CTY16_04340 [Methylobacter sp.]|nr:MAG: hypothetical protein CTY16_04340 [Methylobacter sp.]
MLTCKKMTDLLSDSLDMQLSWPKRWAMRLHLTVCKNCRRYRKQLLFMKKMLDSRGKAMQLPETARLRIKEKLAGKTKG